MDVQRVFRQFNGLITKDDSNGFKTAFTSLSKADKLKVLEENGTAGTLIQAAAYQNRAEVVNCIVSSVSGMELSALLKIVNKSGSTAIHCAAGKGHTDSLKSILNAVPQSERLKVLLMQNHFGTAIYRAAQCGFTDAMKCMLGMVTSQQSVELLNTANKEGKTPFDIATSEGKTSTAAAIKEILKNSPTAQPQGCGKLEPNAQVEVRTTLQKLREFIAKGYDSEFKAAFTSLSKADKLKVLEEKGTGSTLIQAAAYQNRAKVVNCIVSSVSGSELSALLKIANNVGSTAIHCAAGKGHTESLKSILNAVPQSERLKILLIQNQFGTAVYRAAQCGFTDAMKCMLGMVTSQQSVELLNTANKEGKTPFDIATSEGKTSTAAAIKEILKNSPTAQPQGDETSLEKEFQRLTMALDNTEIEKVKQVLTKMTKDMREKVLSELTAQGTILHKAAHYGQTELVEFIVELLPRPSFVKMLKMKNKANSTAVHCAAGKGHTEIIKHLLELIPEGELHEILQVQNHFGTAVFRAAQCGFTEAVKHMLEKVSPNVCLELLNTRNHNEKTPLDIANQGKHVKTAACIQEIHNKVAKKVAETVAGGLVKEAAGLTQHKTSIHSQQMTVAGTTGAGKTKTVTGKTDAANKTTASGSNQSQQMTSNEGRSTSDSTSTLAEILKDIKMGEKLGSGGQGVVYKGSWLSTPVAVKMLPDSADLDLSKTSLDQLEEYQAIKVLRHPHIVQFYGVTQVEMGIGLVMELCDTDLSALSRLPLKGSNKRPSQQELLKIIKDAVCGLVYLHSKDLIHLDIKPLNVLVQSGKGKLADFGLSDMTENFMDMAMTHSPWSGTPQYRALELLHRAAPSKAADMWSMGITALEVMTGSPPFKNMIKQMRTWVPQELIDERLPTVLQNMGSNAAIYKLVLNFDHNKRLTAEGWLTELDGYKF